MVNTVNFQKFYTFCKIKTNWTTKVPIQIIITVNILYYQSPKYEQSILKYGQYIVYQMWT